MSNIGLRTQSGNWRSFRAHVLLLVCAFIPIVVLSGTFGFYLTASQRQSLDDGIGEKATRLATALAKEIDTQVQLLTILSESPRLDPPLQIDAFSQLGQRLVSRVDSWQMLRVTDADGKVVLSIPDRGGNVNGAPVVDKESHDEMVRSVKPVVGRLVRGPRSRLAFPVRMPVVRNGKVVYGLSSVIRPETLGAVLTENGLPPDWAGWIADGQGRLVFANFGGEELLTRPLKDALQSTPRRAALTVSTLGDGREMRTSVLQVKGTDWTLAIGMPSNAYASSYRRGLYVLVSTAICTLSLAALAAFLFMRELAARRREEETVASWQRLDALGKLAGGIAHDLNNLLMVFQSGADSIARKPEDLRRIAVMVEGFREAVGRGRTLTQRLLSFTRKSNADAMSVSLAPHIASLREMLGQAAQELVDLDFDLPADIAAVRVDSQSLDTALINLVTNAREAMPGGGMVTVSLRNIDNLSLVEPTLAGPGVAVAVSDEGKGILPEDRHRILEPFYSTKEGASGLGLSQVAAFARRSGGTLSISSVAGRGSVFTILLPRDREAKSPLPVPLDVGSLPKTVLVVDDTPSSLEAACRTLDDAGVRTFAATNAVTALEMLEGHHVDGILSDIRMPGMSGLELLEIARNRHPGLSVVLMTGFSEVVEQGHSVSAPVLMKPFDLAQLVRAFLMAKSMTKGENIVPLRRT